MKSSIRSASPHLVLLSVFFSFLSLVSYSQERLIYHEIRTDKNGNILPWFNDDPGRSFDNIINLVWNFWDTMRTDMNGLPYYMNHQVWEENYNDRRGIGGDQLQMAMSAWRLLYQYSGNERVKANMCFMADYYLSHSLSPADAEWPDIPYPYNTLIYSGIYDGDMVIGKNYTQPDKAGSFGLELVNLYKMTGLKVYLDAAVNIANTLALKTVSGDSLNSPLPFKVNAVTGEIGTHTKSLNDLTPLAKSSYTANWSPTLNLFLDLIKLGKGTTEEYRRAFDIILKWMIDFPLRNNRWGPFFEDVPGWSDTQINAMTFARFIMEHRDYFPAWKDNVNGIFDWVYRKFANSTWENYGVTVVNEQTAYQVPGNSHTARQGADELLYASLSGDTSRTLNAIRQLCWSTYMVAEDGRNSYPNGEIWMTDGYGDYLRHYLRALSADPGLATSDENHILSSTSVLQQVDYHGQSKKILWDAEASNPARKPYIRYSTYDNFGTEVIRITGKPAYVTLDNEALTERETGEGYSWKNLKKGGILKINRLHGNNITIYF